MDMVNYFRHIAAAVANRLTTTERGAALVEYALLLALIAVVCIVALSFLGDSAGSKFSKIGQSIASA